MFYDVRKTLSHNALLNMVVSERGAGKTFSALEFSTSKFKTEGSELAYIRRTDTELIEVKPKLFRALEHEGVLSKNEFSCEGSFIFNNIHDESGAVEDKKIAGHTLALSKAGQYKSNPYSNVGTIIFEEFIPETGSYLKREVELLLSIIETIARMRMIRVILLGNLYSKYNPYFHFFDLDFKDDKEFIKSSNGYALIHNVKMPEYREAKSKTPFAKLIEGTDYGDFILSNKNIADCDDLILKYKGKNKIPYCNFVFEGVFYACYLAEDEKKNLLFAYIEKGEAKNARVKINMDEQLRDKYLNYGVNNPLTRVLKRFAKEGSIFFGDGNVKLAMQDMLKGIR